MKKLFVFLFLTLISWQIFSQDRVNAPTEKFAAKSESITYAPHWYLNPESQKWESTPNNSKKYTHQFGWNFISLSLNRLKVDSDIFYILLVKYWARGYEYPSIQVGMYYEQLVRGYAYTSEDIAKLKGLNNGDEISLINFMYLGNHRINEYSDHSVILSIKSSLQSGKGKNSFFEDEFKLKRTNSNGQSVIRFRLPQKYDRYDVQFEDMYFEMPVYQLNKLLKIYQETEETFSESQ